MNELVEIPIAFREAQDPEKLKDISIAKVNAARKAELITPDQQKTMKAQIEKAFKFDPRYTTSYQEIVAGVGKGNDILIPNCSMTIYFYHLSCTTSYNRPQWVPLHCNLKNIMSLQDQLTKL